MKKTIRLTESDIRRMVSEALNELSPEFLTKAAKEAGDKGRFNQAKQFRQGADDRMQKMYGWDNVENNEGNALTSYSGLGHNNEYIDIKNKNLDHNDAVSRQFADAYATNSLKTNQRNKFFNAKKTRNNMNNLRDPNGMPYYYDGQFDDNFDPFDPNSQLEEAITRAIRKYLR